MALRINYNFQAEFGHVNILKTERNLNTSLERLETGYRINSAKDDAAGLFIADQLNLVASALDQGVRNSQDGISAAQIAETSLAQIYDKLVTIYTKAEQAANDTNASLNRKALQGDINQLIDAIDRIAKATEFNGKKLLNGDFKNQYIHYGPRADQKLSISIDSATAADLGAYAVKGDGQSTSDATKTLSSLITATDFEYNSASDTITVQGVDLSAAFTSGQMIDAKTLADAINKNADLQAKGIEASATNKSVAGTAFSTVSIGTGGLTIDVYVGPETTADFTLTYASGTSLSLTQLIDDINTKAKENNLNLVAKDEGGKLVLETEGETIALEVTAGSGTTIDLGTLIEDASGSVSGGNTGSAVKVGDLTVLSAESFAYDFTGVSSPTGGLGIAATGTATHESLRANAKVDTNENAEYTMKLINAIIKKVDKMRADLGSIQINLETIIQNNEFSAVQTREAESRIRNVDFAKEMANFTKQQTLMQSGMAMLAQANQLPQLVLQLLR
ncbi:flagellin [Persephonella hydrogeniphila]|uniref:Flagellin n=1 Tax=Persephonella hydrogeniphila TaxID=198703 RepID=A0A285N2R4_9AQUI|nr:flagellin [Persephonella hydrogeniphila]SNZ03754.1 flagellin [Persephonella hydrogeniphila]